MNALEWIERVDVPFTAMTGADRVEEEGGEAVTVTVTEERVNVPANALKRVQSGVDEGEISK